RAVQKGVDRLRNRYPEMRIGLRNRAEKVGFERTQNQRVQQALADRPAKALIAEAHRLKPAERLSMRVVAEEVPLAERIADAELNLKTATGRNKRLLTTHLKQLRQVGEVVHDIKAIDGSTVARYKTSAPQSLVTLYQRAKEVADKRQSDLTEAGLLKEETAAN